MNKTFGERIAFIISAISSPYLTIPIFGLIVIAAYSPTFGLFALRSLIFIFFTSVIPFLYVLFAIKAGTITDFHVMVREQRDRPFQIAILGALLLVEIYHLQKAPIQIQAMSAAFFIAGLVFLLISRFWKISMHTSALAGGIATLAFLVDWRFWFLVLVVPMVMWSRVRRGRHTVWQGAAAFILVLGITVITFQFFRVI